MPRTHPTRRHRQASDRSPHSRTTLAGFKESPRTESWTTSSCPGPCPGAQTTCTSLT